MAHSNDDKIYGNLDLPSLGAGFRAVVIGASGGIGGAIYDALSANPNCDEVIGLARHPDKTPQRNLSPIDLDDEASIATAASAMGEKGHVTLVINATGMLHDEQKGITPEKSWKQLDAEKMMANYRANCIGPSLVAKHFLPLLPRQGKAVLAVLSARVGSITDNRAGGWHGYRAAKAGLNMMVVNFAHEMRFRNASAVVMGLHPGTVATALSAPFRNMAKHEIAAPETAAQHLLSVIDAAQSEQSGRCFDWQGLTIPA